MTDDTAPSASSVSLSSAGPEAPAERFGVRQTWELEMLISGAVAFALLQLPSAVDQLYDRLDSHFAGNLFDALFIAHYYAKLALYTLILSFLIHLAARAYWVGLVGLEAVFPQGVRWDKVRQGPITRRLYEERLPSLPSMIVRADNFCSMIFSFSFTIVFVFVFSIFLAGLLGIAALAISRLFLGGEQLGMVFKILVLLVLLPGVLTPLLDKAIGARLDPARRPARLLRALTAFSYRAFFMDLYGTMTMTMFSNVRKRAIYPLFFVAFTTVIGLFLVSEMARSRQLSAGSDVYMPAEGGALEINPNHYESQRPEGVVFPRLPSIQSDVIADPYVKLFIPYYPRYHNPVLAQRCAGAGPLQEAGLRFEKRSPSAPPAGAAEQVLRCLAEIHRVTLDGRPLQDLEFHFFTHPGDGVRGILGYIPTAGLARGSHLLQVEAVPRPEPEKNERPPDPYRIRFWL